MTFRGPPQNKFSHSFVWLISSASRFPTSPLWHSLSIGLEPLDHTAPIHSSFHKLQQALLRAPALTSSNPTWPFTLYTISQGHNTVDVLGHKKGPTFQAVAYLSKQLDNTAHMDSMSPHTHNSSHNNIRQKCLL